MALSKTFLALVVLAAVTEARSIEARAGWTELGCYTDTVSARSLPYAAGVPGGPTQMTVEACESTCLAAGYSLAGVEYADECCMSCLVEISFLSLIVLLFFLFQQLLTILSLRLW